MGRHKKAYTILVHTLFYYPLISPNYVTSQQHIDRGGTQTPENNFGSWNGIFHNFYEKFGKCLMFLCSSISIEPNNSVKNMTIMFS